MGVRWLVCNVRKGTRGLYRGYTWQRLVQSSVQSFEGAPCRAPPKALPEALPEALHEALPEALHEAPSKLYTELHQSSARSSIKALRGAPSKPCTELPQSSTRSSLNGAYSSASVAESPVVLAKALKPRLVVRRKLGVTEKFSTSDHAEFMHMPCIYKSFFLRI